MERSHRGAFVNCDANFRVVAPDGGWFLEMAYEDAEPKLGFFDNILFG